MDDERMKQILYRPDFLEPWHHVVKVPVQIRSYRKQIKVRKG